MASAQGGSGGGGGGRFVGQRNLIYMNMSFSVCSFVTWVISSAQGGSGGGGGGRFVGQQKSVHMSEVAAR